MNGLYNQGGNLQMAQIPASQMNTEKEQKNMLGDVLGQSGSSDLVASAVKLLPMILAL